MDNRNAITIMIIINIVDSNLRFMTGRARTHDTHANVYADNENEDAHTSAALPFYNIVVLFFQNRIPISAIDLSSSHTISLSYSRPLSLTRLKGAIAGCSY